MPLRFVHVVPLSPPAPVFLLVVSQLGWRTRAWLQNAGIALLCACVVWRLRSVTCLRRLVCCLVRPCVRRLLPCRSCCCCGGESGGAAADALAKTV
eukprot:COSAG01_NODE_3968_length_5483_cov_4.305906_10_plen_96_part_00